MTTLAEVIATTITVSCWAGICWLIWSKRNEPDPGAEVKEDEVIYYTVWD
jgi:hypothetical protein